AALHVDGQRAGLAVQPSALGRVVDDPIGREQRPADGAGNSEAFASPERLAPLVDDAHGVDHSAAAQPVERAREAVGDDRAVGNAVRDREADHGGAETRAARGPLLRARGAGQRHPVSVQAMLLALSLRLPAAAYAADGSNPEW